MELFREGVQHLWTHLETRWSDSGADRGDEIFRTAPVVDQPSGTISGEACDGAAPAAMGQHGARPGGIGHDHGEAVGVTDRGGLPGSQEESIAGRRVAVLVDGGSVLLHGLAHTPEKLQAMAEALDVQGSTRVEALSIQDATDAPAGDGTGSQE